MTSPHEGVEVRAVDPRTLLMTGHVRDVELPSGEMVEGRNEIRRPPPRPGDRWRSERLRRRPRSQHTPRRATLVLTAATNFVNFHDLSADPVARSQADLDRLGGQIVRRSCVPPTSPTTSGCFAACRSISVRRRAKDLPTDERLLASKKQPDPALAALFFQYGRYLLIASSRPGGQPANLQGIWNDELNPPGTASTRSTSTPR